MTTKHCPFCGSFIKAGHNPDIVVCGACKASAPADIWDVRNCKDLAYWRNSATYLADCHAANAEGISHRKSLSKAERSRQIAILRLAVDMLGGNHTGREVQGSRRLDSVVQRASEVIADLEKGQK